MKYALCQELFESRTWDDQCKTMQRLGYTGIELAPFSVCAHPRDLLPADRQKLRDIAETHGLEIIGLHWLLAKTTGFHLTADDPRIRAATSDYLALLGDLCADLGGTIMVFGSPAQRSLREGLSREEGIERAVDCFKEVFQRIDALGQ